MFQGYKSSTEYIATQTPLKETINDFWRMVWEQNVDIIVMLSKRFGPKKVCLIPTVLSHPIFESPVMIIQRIIDKLLMPFLVHTKFTYNSHKFSFLPLSPTVFLHMQLDYTCRARHCIRVFKDFGNIPNSKKRYPVVFSEKKNPLYSRLSLSRLRLSRITAYLEEKI